MRPRKSGSGGADGMQTRGKWDRFEILPVEPSDWPQALTILFARFPEEEQAARLEAALQSVAAGTLRLDGLRWALQRGQPVGAALAMEQPDGITLVWPPIITCGADDAIAVEDALLTELTREMDRSSAKLGQILFDPAEIDDLGPYVAHGFCHETDLFFMARSLHDPLPDVDLRGLSCEPFDESVNAERFAAALEASYRDSLDCVLLDGLRTGREALASHKLSGRWDAALWRLYQASDGDAAVLLLNDHPDQDAVELVYFGVTPENRGRGYGRALLCEALALAAARGRGVMFAAVDAKNRYANSIYAEAGFVELAPRKALFRYPGGLARE
jgi:ribosomal protein S18 acetylase RimI-like enzyme